VHRDVSVRAGHVRGPRAAHCTSSIAAGDRPRRQSRRRCGDRDDSALRAADGACAGERHQCPGPRCHCSWRRDVENRSAVRERASPLGPMGICRHRVDARRSDAPGTSKARRRQRCSRRCLAVARSKVKGERTIAPRHVLLSPKTCRPRVVAPPSIGRASWCRRSNRNTGRARDRRREPER